MIGGRPKRTLEIVSARSTAEPFPVERSAPLSQEQIAVLLAEIQNDPKNLGYAQYLPDSPGHIVRILNEQKALGDQKIFDADGLLEQAYAPSRAMELKLPHVTLDHLFFAQIV